MNFELSEQWPRWALHGRVQPERSAPRSPATATPAALGIRKLQRHDQYDGCSVHLVGPDVVGERERRVVDVRHDREPNRAQA